MSEETPGQTCDVCGYAEHTELSGTVVVCADGILRCNLCRQVVEYGRRIGNWRAEWAAVDAGEVAQEIEGIEGDSIISIEDVLRQYRHDLAEAAAIETDRWFHE